MNSYTEWKALERKLTERLEEMNWLTTNKPTKANKEELRKVMTKLRRVTKVVMEMEAQ